MKNLNLRIYPDDVLRKISKNIEKIDSDIINTVSQMDLLMNENKGIGLAAPQVGISKRFFITKDFQDEDSEKFLVFINPTIKEMYGTIESKEGCLSIPGYYDLIKRHEKILVSYLDQNGKNIEKEFSGMQSIVFQHEFDHLEGILFPDKLPLIRKEIFFKKINKEFKK
tara:strand:- start:160 stop:663 length:504 start_codon:yes stop_codon:yes gene_type:complete